MKTAFSGSPSTSDSPNNKIIIFRHKKYIAVVFAQRPRAALAISLQDAEKDLETKTCDEKFTDLVRLFECRK